MKKLILSVIGSAAVVLAAYTSSVFGATISATVVSGTMTNLLSTINSSVKVTSITLTSATNGASRVEFWDTPTNALSFSAPAYTNTISYATNLVGAPGSYWTNYFGVINTNFMLTNVLVDVPFSNGAATVSYPLRFVGATAAGTSTTFGGVNYYFNNGLWITNVSSGGGGPATVTVTYQQ